jgi:hypothetical protein
MIEKPSIIITSLGRTGTTFFSRLFREIIPGCDSFHEPDIVQYFGARDRIRPFLQRVRDAGFYNMVILKALGKWSLIMLSDARARGEMSEKEASRELLRHRRGFVNSKPGSVYVESNAGYYGLLDILKNVYARHRAIYLVRDGRDWVSSAMNVGELYGRQGLRKMLAHKMPAASEFPGDPLEKRWESISRFEKLCWAWARLNSYAADSAARNPQARVFRFESIFTGLDKYQALEEVVAFAVDLPGIDRRQIGSTEGWLERKINESSNTFPAWQAWTEEQRCQFKEICGPLMQRLGYEF